jgi:hypothetical protein
MSDDRIDLETFLSEVEARANKATPVEADGQWLVDAEGFGIASCDKVDDAQFYANAVTDVPRLLQIVRAQQLADGLNTVAFRALQEIVQAMQAEKQAVIDGMTRAITAEGKANEAFYAMKAERDALRERVGKLEEALGEALDGWEYAAQYKGEFLAAKHGDASDIAEMRKLLKGSDNGPASTGEL